MEFSCASVIMSLKEAVADPKLVLSAIETRNSMW